MLDPYVSAKLAGERRERMRAEAGRAAYARRHRPTGRSPGPRVFLGLLLVRMGSRLARCPTELA